MACPRDPAGVGSAATTMLLAIQRTNINCCADMYHDQCSTLPGAIAVKSSLSTYAVLLLLIACGLLGLGLLAIRQEQINQSYQETVNVAVLTNTVVFIPAGKCAQIEAATGCQVSCDGNIDPCGRSMTKTPSPTDPRQPTWTRAQASATLLQRTTAPINTVQAICATLGASGRAADCPQWWLDDKIATLTAIAFRSPTR